MLTPLFVVSGHNIIRLAHTLSVPPPLRTASDLFHFFLIDSAISWYSHINQPHLLLFNHCYVWFFMSQTFVCLYFKVQRILTSSFCSTFSTLCFYHFPMHVDGNSCTDSNKTLKLLYYDALYNLSVQFFCMNWLSGLLSRLFLCIIGP